MTTITVVKHRCDGSGRKHTYKIKPNCWHDSHLDGSNGRQPMWYYICTDGDAKSTYKAVIYEDRNPHYKMHGRLRRYRWDVYPADGCTYSFARGDSVSLAGAKMFAEACMGVADFAKPYNERVHRR